MRTSTVPERACEQCGRMFRPAASALPSTWGRCCSRACAAAFRRKPVECLCEFCGKTFILSPSYARDGLRRFCCRACKTAWAQQPRVISGRFWSKVDRSDDCWLWTGSRVGKGYGSFSVGLRSVPAHRFAYEDTYGAFPDELYVCHRCDNPPCVRPDHLFLGTNQENTQDKVSKGRQVKGSSHARAKLTTENVREIRSKYAEGVWTCDALGRMYGVTKGTISNIVSGRAWKETDQELWDMTGGDNGR